MPDSVIKEYSRLSGRYDKKWSFYMEATIRETIKRLHLKPSDRIVDVGCGTGMLLHQLSKIHPAELLHGIDITPAMLKIARNRLPPSVQLCVSEAEHLPFPVEYFDMVISCSIFHYISEPVIALNEIKRALRPGGSLFITDWCSDYLSIRFCDAYLRLFSRAYCKSYHKREWMQLLKETGFTVTDTDRYKINWLWGLLTIKAVKDIV